jgi:drug/metabolite transporter (DMT)-like permease
MKRNLRNIDKFSYFFVLKKQTYFLIAILAIIWGSSFILMKRALIVYSPLQVGTFRIVVAFIFLFPFILTHFKKIDRSNWIFFIATGFFGNGIPAILFPLAETKIDSALAGMINSLTPIFTLIAGVVIFGMKVSRNRVVGLTIGLAGALLLIVGGKNIIGGANLYALFVVAAAICYALSINILNFKLKATDSIRNTGFALMFTGIPMGIILFSTDFVERTIHAPGSVMSLSCIFLLGMLSTALSTVLFNKLIKTSGGLAASSVTYLIPIVAVIWGFLDGEKFGVIHLIGLSLILIGVYLINRRHRERI